MSALSLLSGRAELAVEKFKGEGLVQDLVSGSELDGEVGSVEVADWLPSLRLSGAAGRNIWYPALVLASL